MEQLKIPQELKGKELTAWLVEKRDELLDNLCQDPQELEKFIRLWDSTLGLHNYSIKNMILAYFQYPKLSMLAGFKKWGSLGRTVIKGSKAIKILAPLRRKVKDGEEDEYILYGFRYVNVFDVAMTEGKNLDFGHSDKIKGNVSFEEVKKISPLPVIIEYAGTSNGNITPERILIAPKDNEASMVASLCHEIAHYHLEHLDGDLDRETKEVEAETVSYIVTSYLGLDNEKSKYYVGSWNSNNGSMAGRGAKIMAVAESIIKDLKSLN